MPKIPLYEETRIIPRAVPNMVDESKIDSPLTGVATATANIHATLEKHREADETTAVNEAVIAAERKKIEGINELRTQWMNNPDGYNKAASLYYSKIDEDAIAGLPSSRAKTAYRQTAAHKNNGLLSSDMAWENNRKVEVYAGRVETVANDLSSLAIRYGQEGRGIDELYNHADATTVAGSTFLSSDKIADVNRKLRNNIAEGWLGGIAEKSPSKAKALLDSGKYDEALGGDGINKVNRLIEHQTAHQRAMFNLAKAEENDRMEMARIANAQSMLKDVINNPSLDADAKSLSIAKAELEQRIPQSFAEDARRYIKASEINIDTDQRMIADIVQRMYDVNQIAQENPKQYQSGLMQIQSDIMNARADGKISKDMENKLIRQMTTITSNKNAEATRALSFGLGKARKDIEQRLSSAYWGDATRKLNDWMMSEDGQKVLKSKSKAEIENILSGRVSTIIKEGFLTQRDDALKSIERVRNGEPTQEKRRVIRFEDLPP